MHVFCRAAWIDKCRPDVLITESTYATTIRDSKRFVVLYNLYMYYNNITARSVTSENQVPSIVPQGSKCWETFELSSQILINSSLPQSKRNSSSMGVTVV